MSIHVALNHVMHYRYDRPVTLGAQVVRLRPAPHCRTRILSYSLTVTPAEHYLNWQQDPQSNYLARLVFQKPTQELRIEVDLTAEMAVLNPFDFFLEPGAQQFPFKYGPTEKRELAPFLATGPATPLFTRYLAGISLASRPTNDFLVDLNRRLASDVRYVIRMEPGVQSPEETLEASIRILPRLGGTPGSAAEAPRVGRAFRIGLPHSTGRRYQALGGPGGTGRGFHRLACLVRGVLARRRMDRIGSHLGFTDG